MICEELGEMQHIKQVISGNLWLGLLHTVPTLTRVIVYYMELDNKWCALWIIQETSDWDTCILLAALPEILQGG